MMDVSFDIGIAAYNWYTALFAFWWFEEKLRHLEILRFNDVVL